MLPTTYVSNETAIDVLGQPYERDVFVFALVGDLDLQPFKADERISRPDANEQTAPILEHVINHVARRYDAPSVSNL